MSPVYRPTQNFGSNFYVRIILLHFLLECVFWVILLRASDPVIVMFGLLIFGKFLFISTWFRDVVERSRYGSHWPVRFSTAPMLNVCFYRVSTAELKGVDHWTPTLIDEAHFMSTRLTVTNRTCNIFLEVRESNFRHQFRRWAVAYPCVLYCSFTANGNSPTQQGHYDKWLLLLTSIFSSD